MFLLHDVAVADTVAVKMVDVVVDDMVDITRVNVRLKNLPFLSLRSVFNARSPENLALEFNRNDGSVLMTSDLK